MSQIRVASRPNPQIDLGPVDCNAAITVCDTFKRDTPIVYCSEAFTHLTGYDEREVLGRNCRFLQSPPPSVERQMPQLSHHTASGGVNPSRSEISRVRSALERREEVQVSLRNYTRSGAPFANFVTIIPVRWQSDSDELRYMVGFQARPQTFNVPFT